jgi:hypothetical protein
MKTKLFLSAALLFLTTLSFGQCTETSKTLALNFNHYASSGVTYTNALDYSDLCTPKKIEVTLEVTNLVMGINNGSVLQILLQRSIDGISWIDYVSAVPGEFFNPVKIGASGDPENTSQVLLMRDNQFLGNRLRFKMWISTSNPAIPSQADIKLTALVK